MSSPVILESEEKENILLIKLNWCNMNFKRKKSNKNIHRIVSWSHQKPDTLEKILNKELTRCKQIIINKFK